MSWNWSGVQNLSYLAYVHFDVTLSDMQRNYQIWLDSIKRELYSWKFRHLTFFGKLTVIKTLCLPKLTHVFTIVPNPCSTFITELESAFKHFIAINNPSVVCEVTRHMRKNEGGLGMLKINQFWKAIRMSWLRRLITSKSTWAHLHKTETSPCLLYTSPSPRD